jgi:TolB-like protein/Tfp pilus assembly protein PilF
MSEETKRKLAAILAADVVGYSRLMGEDEAGTLAMLRQFRAGTLEPAVAEHRGEIVKSMGDGWLIAFDSATDAVNCAIATQERIAGAGGLQVRIGLHSGEVTYADGDVFGDGVNIAARLQEVADPGAIVISGTMRRSIDGKLSAGFADLGAQELKNIAEPVDAFGLGMSRVSRPSDPPALPDKPSIAVLPFANMSGDEEQEYFADGITEDIITALSKFRWFFVIARNSTFVFKNQAVDVRDVGRQLGVRYVLEGSVRKAGQRVRITAQLIEAETANHVWAERYDRALEDIFELQDEITATIAAAIEPELAGSELQRSLRKPTDNLGAWDLLQRGLAGLWRQDRASMEESAKLFRQAVTLDPEFGQAYGYLAFNAGITLFYEWAEDRERVLRQGFEDANRALAIDRRDYFAFHALGRLHTVAGDHQSAVRALEASVDINPNFAQGYVGLAEAHVYGGDPEKAVAYCDLAIRLSPNDPLALDMFHYKASAYVRMNEFDLAIENFERVCEFQSAQYVPAATLAALYVLQDREADGRRALKQALTLDPGLTIDVMKNVYGVTEERPGSRTKRLLDALRTLGVPEA